MPKPITKEQHERYRENRRKKLQSIRGTPEYRAMLDRQMEKYYANRTARLAAMREAYRKNPEKYIARANRYREANLEKVRAYDRERATATRPGRVEYYKAYCADNAHRIRELHRRYAREHADELKQNKKQYYAKTKQEAIARAVKWGRDNPERKKASGRRYYQNNTDYYRELCAARRAKIAQVTIGDRKEIAAFYRYVKSAKVLHCYWCKKRISKVERCVDHMIPLSRGGPHSLLNLVPSHQLCNIKKKAKLPHEFTGQHELFT